MTLNADFKTEIKTRNHDNKTILWGYVYDPTFQEPITEKNEVYISRRWVTLGVFDDEPQAQKEARNWHRRKLSQPSDHYSSTIASKP